VLNLVMNGSKHARVIGRARVLRVRSEIVPPANIAVTIEDTGTGFGNNGLDRIFETLFTTKEEAWNGPVDQSLDRTVSRGRLWLHRETDAVRPSASPCRRLWECKHDDASYVIMIVDDDTSMRRAARRLIKSHGFRWRRSPPLKTFSPRAAQANRLLNSRYIQMPA